MIGSCVQPVSQGGGGSEVEVTGLVYTSDNTPAVATQVKLIPQNFNALSEAAAHEVLVDTSDTDGHYSFKNVKQGIYNIQAVKIDERTRMLITGIVVDDHQNVVPAGRLLLPGVVKLMLPYSKSHNGFARIPGTDIITPVTAGKSEIIIDSVPEGIVPSIVFSNTDDTGNVVLARDVQVVSSQTTAIIDTSWHYKQQIVLNTSVSGANVTGTVYKFPVLVRLTKATFNFSQAQNHGNDICFTSIDGRPLYHEIEQWDSIGTTASLWVMVDTISGNNSSQSIMMYWGSPDVTTSPLSQSVFDTAAGFEGVWHLNEAGDENVIDATGNHFDGIAYHMSTLSPARGVIGYAHQFDGDSGYIRMPNTASGKLNFSETDTFTLSAWVYADTFDNVYRTIATKGYQQYFLQLSYFPSGSPLWQLSTYYQQDNWHMSDYTATARSWVLLTCVKQGNSQYLYCNSELVDNSTTVYSHKDVVLNRDTTDDFSIGRFLKEATYPTKFGYCYFKGKIDEVRVSSVARSADWIRLSYMNQRNDNTLVQFKQVNF